MKPIVLNRVDARAMSCIEGRRKIETYIKIYRGNRAYTKR